MSGCSRDILEEDKKVEFKTQELDDGCIYSMSASCSALAHDDSAQNQTKFITMSENVVSSLASKLLNFGFCTCLSMFATLLVSY